MEAIKALENVFESLDYPYSRMVRDTKTGAPPVFFVYRIISGRETFFSDDCAAGTETILLIELYAKDDYGPVLQSIISALRTAGFIGIRYGPEDFDAGTRYSYMPIEAKYFIEHD